MDAKTHLSRLLTEFERRGGEVVITRAGRPVARLVRHEIHRRTPVFGADRGTFKVPNDFDAPLPDSGRSPSTEPRT
ncbi:MAG TPA: type II toxin-antitoxin system prevent-host-death family antitoxin [Polyangia bacterium]|nr:type II toxin-antitoxin system prevent-host-death family antitoxin [Polyangia bacterium]